MAAIGFFMVAGAVGTSDLMSEAGEYQSFGSFLLLLVPGILLMLPAIAYAVIDDQYDIEGMVKYGKE